MRILHLIPYLSGAGAERQLSYLSLSLAKKGHEIHIGYLYDGPQPVAIESVTLHKLTVRGHYDPRIFTQILGLIRSIKPDIVQTWLLMMDVTGGMASKLANVPWVLREAACGFDGGQLSRNSEALKESIRVRVASTANGIIANSRGGLEYWNKFYNSGLKLVIQNGFPYDLIASIPEGPINGVPVAVETKIVLTGGRFDTQKRFFSCLADVIPLVLKTNLHFVVFGGGPTLPQVIQKVNALGLARYVTFLGHVPFELVIRWMRRSDLFCFMGEFEGFPNVLAEAVLCECPVVLSDIPVHRELLDDQSVFFANPRCPNEIAEGILRMLRSPDRAHEMARRASSRMKEFTISRMAGKYEDAYAKILGVS
jgi:glycosyltransferase involved in cell wall biosynthesis